MSDAPPNLGQPSKRRLLCVGLCKRVFLKVLLGLYPFALVSWRWWGVTGRFALGLRDRGSAWSSRPLLPQSPYS